MGMFTSVIHKGKELQIKTGWDSCDTYTVGDRIDWKPDEFWPGSHIDGVYDAHEGSWVVIKDCTIVAVEPRGSHPIDLRRKYNIGVPPRSLWSEKAWRDLAAREAKYEEEWQAWKKEHGDNPFAFYMHKKLGEKSIFEQLFPATPSKEHT